MVYYFSSFLAELGELLPRAFARLGLPPMSRDDAAKLLAMEKMRAIAQQLVLEKEDPLRGANAIYWRAMEAGAFGDDDDVDPRVAKYGVEFLQLSDTLEERQRDPANKHQFEQLIIEAAATLLAGEPVPEWYLENGELCRGRPPWAAPPETTR